MHKEGRLMMAVHSVSYFSFQVSVCTGKLSRSIWIYFNIFLVIWINCYNTSVTGEPQVIGSSQAVLAKVGDDVTLPCHIEPSVDATRMTVEWTRRDLQPEFVHHLQNGHNNTDFQNPLYTQRAFLFADKLSHGNISLKLFRVTFSDEGAYKCFVPTLRDSSWIQLLVGAVSQPVISIIGPKDGGLSLTCDSGCWYPQPEVSWLDSEGNLLINESSVTVGHTQHCYTVQRNVTARRTGRVTCRVHLPHVNHAVEIHHVIPIAEHVITDRSGAIAAIVFTVIVILVAASLGYLYGKKKRRTAVSEKFKVTVDDQGANLEDAQYVEMNVSGQIVAPSGDLAGGVTSPCGAVDGLTSIETDEEKAHFVMQHKVELIQHVSRVMAVVGHLGSKVHPKLHTKIEAIPTSMGKMFILYNMVMDEGETDTRAAFYDALKKHEPYMLEKHGVPLTQDPFDGLTSEEIIAQKAQLVIQHGTALTQNVSEVMPIVERLNPMFRNRLQLNAEIRGKETSMSQMMCLYAMELEQGTPEIKAAFYDALKQHEPNLLKILGRPAHTILRYLLVPIHTKSGIRSIELEDYHPGGSLHISGKGKATMRRSSSLKYSNRAHRSSSQTNATTNSQPPTMRRSSSLKDSYRAHRNSSQRNANRAHWSSSQRNANRAHRSSSQRNATTNSQPLLHRNSSLREAILKWTLADAETTRSNRGSELIEGPYRRRSNTACTQQDLYRDRYDEDRGQRGQDGSERREGQPQVERERLMTDGEDPDTERDPLRAETEDHLEPDTEIDIHNQTC